jgi:hypothetical protein
MQEICTLSFAIEPLSDDDPVPSIVPIVNGIRLTALVEEFERQHLYEPVGGYAGMVPTHFNFGPIDQYFLATSMAPPFVDKRWLLGCECGEVGCWPLEAHIVANQREFIWEGFKQPFRPERDYSSFGPFRFEHDQYRRSVIELASALRAK